MCEVRRNHCVARHDGFGHLQKLGVAITRPHRVRGGGGRGGGGGGEGGSLLLPANK